MMNAAPTTDDQQFCLRWNNHQTTIIANFDSLLQNSMLVDCTLAAEGRIVKAHKVVLSACSPYFAELLIQNYDKHPIFILKDVKFKELEAMMDYMYRGEVNVSQDQLPYLLKAAESLQIKGLSDKGSTGEPKPENEDQREHRGMNVSGGIGGVKLPGGYTLEQAHVTPASKRVRIGGALPSSMDAQNVSGSREGSSSPSRRRRKVRRRSIENAMTEVHDNSNSSQIQSNQSLLLLQQQQQQQSNASLAGVGAITAAASALASQIPVSAAAASAGTTSGTIAQGGGITAQQMTTSGGITKKTESVKGTSGDAMNTENIQTTGAVGGLAPDDHMKSEKQNHKQQKGTAGSSNKDKDASDTMVIEPKSEYDEEGNDETVEDLTLDDEEMGMDDLDHNAGTSQGGEGSSQGYAPWQHERSQDELLLATQEQQQRDPQGNRFGIAAATVRCLSPTTLTTAETALSYDTFNMLNTLPPTISMRAPLRRHINRSSSGNTATHRQKQQQRRRQYQQQQQHSNNRISSTANAKSTIAATKLHPQQLRYKFECDMCPTKTYKSYGSLARHKRVECNKEPVHSCIICHTRFYYRDTLRLHMARVHHA